MSEGDTIECPECGAGTVYTINPGQAVGTQMMQCGGCSYLVGVGGEPVRPPRLWTSLSMRTRRHLLGVKARWVRQR